jgi:hypothetical protein
MPAPQKENVGIVLPQLKIGTMDVLLVGDTPLVVHAWSVKAKRSMLAKQTKAAKGGREAKNPQDDFEQSLYRLPDGGYGFPSVAFKSAAVTAITSISGVTKIAARQAFQILGENVEVEAALDGVRVRQDLVRVQGDPRLREDMVRVGMGSADLRYRGEFFPWRASILVRFNEAALSPEQIVNLLNVSGFAVGVGEWRPERDGQMGMFHVATEKEATS